MTDATALSERPPRVFISYSWEPVVHKAWVLAFAYSLVDPGGVDVVLDQWHLRDGDDKTYFMEQSVAESDYVLVVCTPTYAQKANDRAGGIGYEAMILTSELAQSVLTRRFIPVLREGEWNNATPRWLSTRFGRDLRGDPCSPEEFEQLLRTLHGAHLRPPKPGPRPNFAPPATPRLIFTPATPSAPTHETPPSTAFATPPAEHPPSSIPSSTNFSKSPSKEESESLRQVKTSFFRPTTLGAIALVVLALFAVGVGLWARRAATQDKTPPISRSTTQLPEEPKSLICPSGNPPARDPKDVGVYLICPVHQDEELKAEMFGVAPGTVSPDTQNHFGNASDFIPSGTKVCAYRDLVGNYFITAKDIKFCARK